MSYTRPRSWTGNAPACIVHGRPYRKRMVAFLGTPGSAGLVRLGYVEFRPNEWLGIDRVKLSFEDFTVSLRIADREARRFVSTIRRIIGAELRSMPYAAFRSARRRAYS